MLANNLTISIPTEVPCDKCRYCVSKMTMQVKEDYERFKRNLPTALATANRAGVDTVLITSKDEPLDNLPRVFNVLLKCKEYLFITELQIKPVTKKDVEKINKFIISGAGLDVVSVSIDDPKKIDLISQIDTKGDLLRITINLTKNMWSHIDTIGVIEFIRTLPKNINQVTFRDLTIPKRPINTPKSRQVQKWIKDNKASMGYNSIMQSLNSFPIDEVLNFGAVIREVHDRSVVCMDYCIQERSTQKTTRSLVLHSNGDLSTSWNSKATRKL